MHSKHVFLFPFRWDILYKGTEPAKSSYEKRTSLGTVASVLDSNPYWEEAKSFTIETADEYNVRTYFHPFVRRAIFPAKQESLLKQYIYKLGVQPVTYQINVKKVDFDKTKGKGEVVYRYEEEFKLNLESISLTLYNVGVGILAFTLINDKYDNPEDILHINDYGRRLYPQFLGSGFDLRLVKNNFLAYSIAVYNDGKSIDYYTNFDNNYAEKPDYLPPHILSVLNDQSKADVDFVTASYEQKSHSKPSDIAECIRIEPILDDRMFVLCWYGNPISSKIASYDTETNSLDGLKEVDDFWYRYVFVDNSDISSSNPIFVNKLVDEHTYSRWAAGTYNTLYGVSRYSFVALSEKNWFAENILSNHLSSMYQYLVQLCLVQRASLLRFSGEVAYISRFIDNNDKKENLFLLTEQVQQLNKSFILFDNRIYFQEVTAQEQGIELYDLLQQKMRIGVTFDNVKREIGELNNYLQVTAGENERQSLDRLSLLGGLFLVPGFVLSYLGWGILKFGEVPVTGLGYVLISVVLFLLVGAGLLTYLNRAERFLASNTRRTWTFAVLLLFVASAIAVPAYMSYQHMNDVRTQSTSGDSVMTKRVSSLEAELKRLRSQLPSTTPTRSTSTTTTR